MELEEQSVFNKNTHHEFMRNTVAFRKESLNRDGKIFHQDQQSEKSPLASTH